MSEELKNFPSLKGKRIISMMNTDNRRVHIRKDGPDLFEFKDIQKYCLDKQKVRDIFDKFTLTGSDDKYIHNYEGLVKELKKELKL